MKSSTRSHHLVAALSALALTFVSCRIPDVAGRDVAIENALTQACRDLEIPTGPELKADGERLALLKQAETAGLIELRRPSWMAPGLMEAVATAKLVGVALNPDGVWTARDSERYLGGEAGDDMTRFTARVRVKQAKIVQIINDEDYEGPLAAPGEKHRVVLGTYQSAPTTSGAVVGAPLVRTDEAAQRFRCIVKYSEFKKTWSVVAYDIGSLEPEQWFTSNVM